MEKYIELTPEEIRLGFVSSCVEFVASALKRPYKEVFHRMKHADMLEHYIYACYEPLHTESRENVTAELVELLNRREAERA